MKESTLLNWLFMFLTSEPTYISSTLSRISIRLKHILLKSQQPFLTTVISLLD
ncbi:CQS_1a_G0030220.mRNA.1.CDS.1 [Saccharomyces cerevisiae]|nr:CQS_1a_G0030220.mRNA.1.CDS.1 [Saccharomyces cerevisiae]CAI7363730.1 CQS_1a_G0030220.mRNA.1.CDS.1 [Saccharomyces cerevisiae]